MNSSTTALPYWHNPQRENRIASLNVGMPADVLLGVLCHSNANVEKAANYFMLIASGEPDEVAGYLRNLIERFVADLDFSSCELNVKPGCVDSSLDFGRPSPARMLVWQFFGMIARNDYLHSQLKLHPGAGTIFHSSFVRR